MELLGTPLLITRGKDGRARAFINACRHRGAPLAEDGTGNCSRFSCPYHGWTYRNDGALQGISDAEKFGDVDKATLNLVELACEERVGFIFVMLLPGKTMEIDSFLGGMQQDLGAFNFQDWHFIGVQELKGPNWKISYDGYLEGYHFTALHPETIATVTLNNLMDFTAYGPHLRVAYGTTKIDSLQQVPKADWHKEEDIGFSFVRLLFPNISIYLGLGVGQIAQLIPGPTAQENRTLLYYVHRTPPKDAEEAKSFDDTMYFLRDVVRDEDYALNLRIQKTLNTAAFENVVFGRNEKGNQFFHKWVEYYVSGKKDKAPTL